jgi:hypothetical protein
MPDFGTGMLGKIANVPRSYLEGDLVKRSDQTSHVSGQVKHQFSKD